MTDLTPEQIAARQSDGKFGTHDHSDPELELGNAYRDVTSPLTVQIRLEQREGDYAREVGRVELDARALFDARSLADLEGVDADDNDQDWVFFEGSNAGLVPEHDGPFTVELPEDFREYIEHREDNGMVEPYEGAAESLAVQVREANLAKRQDALELADRLLHAAGDGATETKRVDAFEPGDILVKGTSRLTVENIEKSSSMPGFLAVETEFGTLYLDPELEFEVEAG